MMTHFIKQKEYAYLFERKYDKILYYSIFIFSSSQVHVFRQTLLRKQSHMW